MFKLHIILFWVSGLSLGLMVCAIFSCPQWPVAMPFMFALSGATGALAFKQQKQENMSEN